MKAVIERVRNCTLKSQGEVYSHIDNGLLVLFGVGQEDTIDKVEHFAQKILKMRIIRDKNDKLNLDIKAFGGEIMLVSNFTLYGRTKNTNRPDFTKAADPKLAKQIYEKMLETLGKSVKTVSGVFGTHMDIEMIADGPTTILLEE